jgi:regulator of replication initiation timing
MSGSSIALRRQIKTLTNRANKTIEQNNKLTLENEKLRKELDELRSNHKFNQDASDKIAKLEKTVDVNIQYIKKMREENNNKTKRLELTVKTLTERLNNKEFLKGRMNKLNGNPVKFDSLPSEIREKRQKQNSTQRKITKLI